MSLAALVSPISSSPALPVGNPAGSGMLESLSCSEFHPAGEGRGGRHLRGRGSIPSSCLPGHQGIRERDFIKPGVSINPISIYDTINHAYYMQSDTLGTHAY